MLKPFDHCFIDEFHKNLGFHGWICSLRQQRPTMSSSLPMCALSLTSCVLLS